MKREVIIAGVVGFFVALAACGVLGMARPGMPGGYSAISVTNASVVAAATFAIAAQSKAMAEKTDMQTEKLELVRIVSAQHQVVAGANYHLTLKVKVSGKESMADVVVWWQAWRTPDPYQLTSWIWK